MEEADGSWLELRKIESTLLFCIILEHCKKLPWKFGKDPTWIGWDIAIYKVDYISF